MKAWRGSYDPRHIAWAQAAIFRMLSQGATKQEILELLNDEGLDDYPYFYWR